MLKFANLTVAVLLSATVLAVQASDTQLLKLNFGGLEYQHRWSQRGQHEFTPEGQEDLARWQDMLTVNVHEAVTSDEQLKELAMSVLSNYRRVGKVLRAASGAKSERDSVEYFVAALLGNSQSMEAVFARIVLINNTGFVLARSRRGYGSDAAQRIGEWVQSNGTSIERSLLEWNSVPFVANLKKLPESKK